jgi:hypothetical protein
MAWWVWIFVGIGALSATLFVLMWALFAAGARSDRLLG